MTSRSDTKTTAADLAGSFIAGMKKRFPNGTQTLTFGGGTVNTTVNAAIASLQAICDNRTAVTTTQADAHAAVAEENAKMPSLLAFMRAVEAFIKLNFGADASALADFGLEPPKARTPLTAEQKAVAAAKREATRQARGITTAAKKKAVKGNVTATLVVTPAASTDAPAAAPATPAKA
jgi:hypothetical protein